MTGPTTDERHTLTDTIFVVTAGADLRGTCAPGPRKRASPIPAAGIATETAEAATGDLAYADRFTVDEAASVVEHSISTSLFPNWIGEAQRRSVDLSGDDLLLERRPSATEQATQPSHACAGGECPNHYVAKTPSPKRPAPSADLVGASANGMPARMRVSLGEGPRDLLGTNGAHLHALDGPAS